MITIKVGKDGNGFVAHVWRIDEDKPKMWLEHSSYQFNSTLLGSIKNNVAFRDEQLDNIHIAFA
jgi:hypothetical protein